MLSPSAAQLPQGARAALRARGCPLHPSLHSSVLTAVAPKVGLDLGLQAGGSAGVAPDGVTPGGGCGRCRLSFPSCWAGGGARQRGTGRGT